MRSATGTSPTGPAPTAQDERPVVFWIVRDSKCAECGEELLKGSFLRMEKTAETARPLCLACADLDHLVFLERGNTALTRRAAKHSTLSAVVVRFSRSRGRYERQGVLVEEPALERAEQECLADEDARALARERAAGRRRHLDENYVHAFAGHIGSLFPRCPEASRQAIARHACLKHSGRVGRSAAAREFDPKAIELAVRAHVRHAHTGYDDLLSRGVDRTDARAEVRGAVELALARWR